ncbi:AT-hook motif nuclear-localized protein 17 [Hibiscus syriacus]|uniref:AT-hook motif nuclear-localized protein 17 n=1 Tax=Hibiscus syriacus TaxID=106335 RepID=A0A6A3CS53_HIBSY|nr:AT-hook motif nuclear-localized protein 28-like [Hibiscus syriacus]KAE8731284.1 AT-hook motif nuclear-localized protein 17 [Hibiscus syriacus]
MKREYVEPKNENPNAMYSTLHHQNHPFSHHFQLSRDSQILESDDIATSASNSHRSSLPSGGGGDGSMEVIRRPRGRPPGSKNKPKPPLVITRESDPSMNPYILEIPGGNDVVGAISRFTLRKNIGICVLTASGAVSNVTLRQPSSTPGATVTFHGKFDILSLSATLLSQVTSCHVPNTFSISLAGPQGQVVGGFVAGSLVAAGTVFIVAATFNNPSYHRLPGGGGEEEEEGRNMVSSGGGGEGQSPPLSGGGGDSGHGGGGGDSSGVSIYSCHLGGPDVIWTPTARPPPP